jgi:hypothetical protein
MARLDNTDMYIQSWIGASQMRGELKKKVIAILQAHFGIPAASKAETRDLVTWLLEKGHFKYGGLDTKVRCSTLKLYSWLIQKK